LKSMQERQKLFGMSHLGKKEGEFYLNKKCSHAKNE
jgi:hypothetical protein